MHTAGANDEFEKQMVIANENCSQFFATMRKDKEKALTSPPFEFEVCTDGDAHLLVATCNADAQMTLTVPDVEY